MSLSSHDEAVLRSCEAGLTVSESGLTGREPGLAEITRFFEQVFGTEPMPCHERIGGRRVGKGIRVLTWLPRMIALVVLAAGRLARRTARGAAGSFVHAARRYSKSLAAAEAAGDAQQREPGGRARQRHRA